MLYYSNASCIHVCELYFINLLIKCNILVMHLYVCAGIYMCVQGFEYGSTIWYVYTSWRVFITHGDTHVEYARGIELRVSDVDPDTFTVFDMPKHAKDLGITNVAEFFYRIPHMELHNGQFPLKKDDDVRALRDWLEFAPEKLVHRWQWIW